MTLKRIRETVQSLRSDVEFLRSMLLSPDRLEHNIKQIERDLRKLVIAIQEAEQQTTED